MESALESTAPRLIEYPADLSGCSFLSYDGRELLYLCSHENGSTRFIVILGFFSGQKQDVITKDLIEPVSEPKRPAVGEAISKAAPSEYSTAQIFFL